MSLTRLIATRVPDVCIAPATVERGGGRVAMGGGGRR